MQSMFGSCYLSLWRIQFVLWAFVGNQHTERERERERERVFFLFFSLQELLLDWFMEFTWWSSSVCVPEGGKKIRRIRFRFCILRK
jgi:hypothetical protein